MRLCVVPVLAAVMAGCVAYRPKVLSPPALEDAYRARSWHDPGLVAALGSEPGNEIDLRALARAGYYFSPELAAARAQMVAAGAAVHAAGVRPSPSLGVEAGYNTSPESHLLYSVLPAFTIETAGKRGLRILQAEHQAEASRAGFAEAGWRVRSRIRSALYNYLLAERRRKLLADEVSLRAEIVDIYEKRLAAGEAQRPELDLYRVDLVTVRALLAAASGESAQGRIAIAEAVGLPGTALSSIALQAPELDIPPAPEALPITLVRKAGLLHRADVRRALAEYAAADAAVRLEVAKQYPDIQLTPGYNFEEGFARYVVHTALQPLPVFHRPRLLIAQAEAEREQAAARFQWQQAQAIGELERALAGYQTAFASWRDAGSRVLAIQMGREEAARRALAAGQGDRLAVATVRLETITASRAELDALARVTAALAALEDAMQQPLGAALQIGDPR